MASAFVVSPFPSLAHAPVNGHVDVHVFVREGCPHCAAEKEFFETWPGVDPLYHEIAERETRELFSRLEERVPGIQQGVPLTYIDGHLIQGFDTAETTGKRLRALIETCESSEDGCLPFEEFLLQEGAVSVTSGGSACNEGCEDEESQFIFDFWWVGPVDLRELSLPALSLLLGGLDGFNPCAMWVLITLLTLLINTRDWRKIWVIGGTFLLVSGVMYYLFIAAWLNVFLLIGLNVWVQKVIGIVAIGGGSFYLYEALGKDPNACKVADVERRRRTIDRMRSVIATATWPAMILGVSVLAVSVNMIELVCTAGLPAVFTQILAFNPLSAAQRYGYLLLYILAYMLDDLIIFAIAVTTLHATGLTTRYRRFTLILGGALMLILGLLLIFYPEALVIG